MLFVIKECNDFREMKNAFIYLKMKEDILFILKSKPDTGKDKTAKIGA